MLTWWSDWPGRVPTRGNSLAMSNLSGSYPAREPITDHEQKKVALGYIHEAWAEARLDGVDGDCMAQACLFAALTALAANAIAERFAGRPGEKPTLAVAVVLQNQSLTGGATAAPIARAVLQALLPSTTNP